MNQFCLSLMPIVEQRKSNTMLRYIELLEPNGLRFAIEPKIQSNQLSIGYLTRHLTFLGSKNINQKCIFWADK